MADDHPARGERSHVPAMAAEVVELLGGRGAVLDMTVGAGGHAEALLRAGVRRVVGLDRDPEAVALAQRRLAGYGDRYHGVVARFSEPPGERFDGVVYDLGVSSMQLDRPERGFGYRADGPLDMRMGGEASGARSAADMINELPQEELARVIFEYGEERQSRRIARAIVRARGRAPIETTDQLAGIVAGAVGRRPGRAHPARRTFQALRIVVNRELEELSSSLPRAVELLAPGGRVVVIAYHSLEDRIVKRFFAGEPSLRVLTRRPLRPGPTEVAGNPRARSARLRAAELSREGAAA